MAAPDLDDVLLGMLVRAAAEATRRRVQARVQLLLAKDVVTEAELEAVVQAIDAQAAVDTALTASPSPELDQAAAVAIGDEGSATGLPARMAVVAVGVQVGDPGGGPPAWSLSPKERVAFRRVLALAEQLWPFPQERWLGLDSLDAAKGVTEAFPLPRVRLDDLATVAYRAGADLAGGAVPAQLAEALRQLELYAVDKKKVLKILAAAATPVVMYPYVRTLSKRLAFQGPKVTTARRRYEALARWLDRADLIDPTLRTQCRGEVAAIVRYLAQFPTQAEQVRWRRRWGLPEQTAAGTKGSKPPVQVAASGTKVSKLPVWTTVMRELSQYFRKMLREYDKHGFIPGGVTANRLTSHILKAWQPAIFADLTATHVRWRRRDRSRKK